MQRRHGTFYYYNPALATHYNNIYPYRKLLLFGGAISLLVGVCLFISVPIVGVASHGFSAVLPVCGFLGVFMIFIGCVGCQCGYASKLHHDTAQNNPQGSTVPYSYTVHGYGPVPPVAGQGYPPGYIPPAGQGYPPGFVPPPGQGYPPGFVPTAGQGYPPAYMPPPPVATYGGNQPFPPYPAQAGNQPVMPYPGQAGTPGDVGDATTNTDDKSKHEDKPPPYQA